MKKYLLICVMFLSSCGGGANSPSPIASGSGTTYAITASSNVNGTIRPAAVTNVTSGGSQAFSMTCNTGYTLNSVTVDGSSVAVSSPYTFTNVVATHTITFTCAAVSVPSSIAAEQALWTNMAVRGTPYYFCDCQTGAAGNCVAGSDSNAGTSASAPKQTLASATAMISGFTGDTNHTIAFCKGGSFNSVATYGESINRSGCTAGTDCDDIREYASPAFTSSAAPILNATVFDGTNHQSLLVFSGNYGGVRIFNLALNDTTSGNAQGVLLIYGAHDVTTANNTIQNFYIGVDWAGDNTVSPSIRSKARGNTFINSRTIAIFGGASNSEIDYNYFEGNGANTIYDHAIYVGVDEVGGLNHIDVIGNYIHGQYGSKCLGNVISMHGGIDYFNITDNTVVIDADKTAGGCTGISVSSGGYTNPVWYHHLVVARNTLINTGKNAMDAENDTGAILEDNLIIQNWAYGSSPGVSQWMIGGISLHHGAQRAQDELSTANTVRNNTVWFGPAVLGGAIGIDTGDQGTNNVLANNTVTYTSTSIGQGVGCYSYTLANAAFAFANNNHCYVAASGYWWRVMTDSNGQFIKDGTQMSLSAWQSYAATQGWDSASITSAPNFVNAVPTYGSFNFKPNTGSPLISAGSHANAPTYDLTNVSTFGNPPDIGAYTH